MKMKISISILLLSLSSFIFSQSTTNPGEYMNYFSSEYKSIQKDMWDYVKSVSHGRSARKVDKKRYELLSTISAALKKAQRAKAFKDDVSYRDSVVAYFNMVDIVLREDYSQIMDMEEIAEQSYDLMEAYMLARDVASDKMSEAGDMIDREHRAFADKYDVKLIESESKLGDKMAVANEVYDHYNKVYLIFFKSYKQELYLQDAMQSKDVSAIEQNRNALIATANEGIEMLESVVLFANDKSMVLATIDLLKFYIQEAENDVDVMLDYLTISENFNKIKASFDQKKEKNRTQEDVDSYNEGVNNLNQAVNTYNAMNDKANKERVKLIDGWNSTSDKFTSKHVPRGK